MSQYYTESGVNLDAGYESVERIKKHVKSTFVPGVMGDLGSFGGLFDLSILNLQEPVLVSGTDGVGTKLLLAQYANRHTSIGIDLVAMCANDVLAQGAKPLFFLDYIAIGKNVPEKIEQIVSGIAHGCKLAQCALIGGETAEMPDMYGEEDYDLAGFCVGVVEKSKMITQDQVKVGDVVIGLSSSGLHSNGYSLVRKILLKDQHVDLQMQLEGEPLIDVLLKPTRIYVPQVKKVLESVSVSGIAHITGGGFIENMPRCLPEGLGMSIELNSWPMPPIFPYLSTVSGIAMKDMYSIFNMGIGMILVVSSKDVALTLEILSQMGETGYPIGTVHREEGVSLR